MSYGIVEDYEDPQAFELYHPRRGEPHAPDICWFMLEETGVEHPITKQLCAKCPYVGKDFDSLVDCPDSMFDHDMKGLEVIFDENA